MSIKKLTSFVLDFATWRSGKDSPANAVGKGETKLLNEQGYMCCLGQYCLQAGISRENILNKATPIIVRKEIPLLNYSFKGEVYMKGSMITTKFTDVAIGINDNPTTTPETKIEQLKKLFESKGVSFTVINKP